MMITRPAWAEQVIMEVHGNLSLVLQTGDNRLQSGEKISSHLKENPKMHLLIMHSDFSD